MHWAQALVFCGGLIYASVDDLRSRTVNDIVCIAIALAGLITISPASRLGALLAALPFYLCAGFGLMGGGDVRLAASAGFVLGLFRTLAGLTLFAFCYALFVLGKSLVLKLSHRPTRCTCPLVPFIAAGFIPAYFL